MRELELGPLGDADGELLAALAGAGTLPAPLERRVLDAAEGNPFFLEELVRSLMDSGALVQDGTGWRYDHDSEIEVPQTVEKVILARLDRLSPESHRVITSASALATFASAMSKSSSCASVSSNRAGAGLSRNIDSGTR